MFSKPKSLLNFNNDLGIWEIDNVTINTTIITDAVEINNTILCNHAIKLCYLKLWIYSPGNKIQSNQTTATLPVNFRPKYGQVIPIMIAGLNEAFVAENAYVETNGTIYSGGYSGRQNIRNFVINGIFPLT